MSENNDDIHGHSSIESSFNEEDNYPKIKKVIEFTDSVTEVKLQPFGFQVCDECQMVVVDDSPTQTYGGWHIQIQDVGGVVYTEGGVRVVHEGELQNIKKVNEVFDEIHIPIEPYTEGIGRNG